MEVDEVRGDRIDILHTALDGRKLRLRVYLRVLFVSSVRATWNLTVTSFIKPFSFQLVKFSQCSSHVTLIMIPPTPDIRKWCRGHWNAFYNTVC